MTSEERRREAAKLRKRKAKQKRLIRSAVIFAGLLIMLVILLIVVVRSRGADQPDVSGETDVSEEAGALTEDTGLIGESGQDEAESGAGDGSQDAADPAANDGGQGEEASQNGNADGAKEPVILELTESMSRTGDLILVNYDHPYDFEANEATLDLTNIREGQSFFYQVGKLEFAVAGRMLPALDSLVKACDDAMGTQLTGIESAYRSVEYQQGVWDEMTELYGEDYAKKYVAVPGYSEHHTGLAVDVGIFYEDGSEGSFSESENAVWMNENACHYGFVRRFAEDKVDITRVNNEAWHFRYVGIPHAVYMTANNLCLEEYIAFLESTEGAEAPITVEDGGHTWQIRYTADRTIEEPANPYTISGTNDGGYVITEQIN